MEMLRRGDADAMLAGGTHTMLHPLGVTGFNRLTALSNRNDSFETAARPFDLTRDGFVMGEGSGMVVIETLDHAQQRGAHILAELIGFGSSADAFRITDIQPEGAGARAAMLEALLDAGIDPHQRLPDGRPSVHYISAHGTGTQENDAIETKAVKSVFGDLAREIPVSSPKSAMGHLIAAAGAVELITCIQAILTGQLPPTINLRTPDPCCDLDYVPNRSRAAKVDVALSNSFGFGGQNDTLIVRRYEE
jgi:3-oxoacyl-[acyl-carrier-protein] synthase II